MVVYLEDIPGLRDLVLSGNPAEALPALVARVRAGWGAFPVRLGGAVATVLGAEHLILHLHAAPQVLTTLPWLSTLDGAPLSKQQQQQQQQQQQEAQDAQEALDRAPAQGSGSEWVASPAPMLPPSGGRPRPSNLGWPPQPPQQELRWRCDSGGRLCPTSSRPATARSLASSAAGRRATTARCGVAGLLLAGSISSASSGPLSSAGSCSADASAPASARSCSTVHGGVAAPSQDGGAFGTPMVPGSWGRSGFPDPRPTAGAPQRPWTAQEQDVRSRQQGILGTRSSWQRGGALPRPATAAAGTHPPGAAQRGALTPTLARLWRQRSGQL
jgi:hypothetical protein